eukprot:9043269-Lingulodinium_polyedra.AAC.1
MPSEEKSDAAGAPRCWTLCFVCWGPRSSRRATARPGWGRLSARCTKKSRVRGLRCCCLASRGPLTKN